jgi:hypothetical protein
VGVRSERAGEFAVVFVDLFLLGWVGSIIWVGIDFRRTTRAFGMNFMRFKSGPRWVILSILAWIIFLPWYLVCRARQRKERRLIWDTMDYQDWNGVYWHRSTTGNWSYFDQASGWVETAYWGDPAGTPG